jgi:hypothetical protein
LRRRHHSEALATRLDTVRSVLARWETIAESAAGAELIAALRPLHDLLVAHLDEEEERILPLVAAWISADEWTRLAQHGFAHMPKRALFRQLGAILEDADDRATRVPCHRAAARSPALDGVRGAGPSGSGALSGAVPEEDGLRGVSGRASTGHDGDHVSPPIAAGHNPSPTSGTHNRRYFCQPIISGFAVKNRPAPELASPVLTATIAGRLTVGNTP